MAIAPEYLHMVHQGPFDALLYGRNSVDTFRSGRSVRDQLTDGRSLCNQHGWRIVQEFTDTGLSASRHARKARDDFEAMLEAIAARKARIVVAFEASRYYRDLEAYVRLRRACLEADVLLCYNGTVYDLSKREDRKATAQDALAAEDEAEGIRDRNLRTVRLNAEAGRPHGHLLEGYARRYDPVTRELVEQKECPKQGPLVRQVFIRAARGESLRSIYTSMNAAGHRTRRGKEWEDFHLRVMLRNPGYLGRRIFRGEDIGTATWPALVDQATFDAVQAILDDPGRNSLPEEGTTVRHLLTNIAICGEHPEQDIDGNPDYDGPEVLDASKRREPTVRMTQNRGKSYISCDQSYDTTIRETLLDAYVEQGVIRWLSSPAAAAAFEQTDNDAAAQAARARAKAMEAQLEEAREASARFNDAGEPELSIASLASIEARLVPLIKKARTESKSKVVPEIVRDLLGNPDAEVMWDALTMGQRRFVLRHVVTVRIFKARTKGVRTIEPGRVMLSYFGQPGFRATTVNPNKVATVRN